MGRNHNKYIPPTGYEAMQMQVSGVEKIARNTAMKIRQKPGWDNTYTVSSEDVSKYSDMKGYLEYYSRFLYEKEGLSEDAAISEANLLGCHLHYMVNFELYNRKVFWVDESLAWMLHQTKLNITGQCLRLPFPCCAIVFTDQNTLNMGLEILKLDNTCTLDHSLGLQIITVYLCQISEQDGTNGISINILFDVLRNKTWPYLISRDLFIRSDDNLDKILDSHFPNIDVKNLDHVFSSHELKQLLHLIINAVLYSTTAHLDSITIQSPITHIKKKRKKLGKIKQHRLSNKIKEMKKVYSAENAFFLPGKIEISKLRLLSKLEKTSKGRTIMKRFMVRGHWRKANPSWKDQNLRWIEPFWKGPDLAAVIEREYRMKI